MQTLFNFLLRLVLVAAGLVFAASLLLVVAVFAAVWRLRYAFARRTGRPVTPFVLRIHPFAGSVGAIATQGRAPQARQSRPARPSVRSAT